VFHPEDGSSLPLGNVGFTSQKIIIFTRRKIAKIMKTDIMILKFYS
jgi:hypothetical protein